MLYDVTDFLDPRFGPKKGLKRGVFGPNLPFCHFFLYKLLFLCEKIIGKTSVFDKVFGGEISMMSQIKNLQEFFGWFLADLANSCSDVTDRIFSSV